MSETPLLLLRHFPSIWNDPKAGRFTGWLDIDLAPGSYELGIALGQKLAASGLGFDLCCTSVLKRAIQSLDAVLQGADFGDAAIEYDARLNERNYGSLQGMLHAEAIEKYGVAQVHEWRRSYEARPPQGESLGDTSVRVVDYWEGRMARRLKQGMRLLVLAHGNSLRALFMHIAGMSPAEIESFEIPTGAPLLCVLDCETLKLRTWKYL